MKIIGWSSTGKKFTYAKPVVEGFGDQVPFFTLPNPDEGVEALAGLLHLNDVGGVKDFDAQLRYKKEQSSTGFYSAGFDQRELSLLSSSWKVPGFDQLPLDTFGNYASNAEAVFTGGDFNGSRYIFRWKPDGSMDAPAVPTYQSSAMMVNNRGYFLGDYQFYDAASSWRETRVKLRGVVLQQQGLVLGQAVPTNGRVSQYTVVSNPQGNPAPTTVVSPLSRNVPTAGQIFTIDIVVDGPWRVEIPAAVDWLAVDVVEGFGNGSVVVTVDDHFVTQADVGNIGKFENRSTIIKVAGQNVTISQDWEWQD